MKKERNEVRFESAEHIMPGHPDKLCDAMVDSIVEEINRLDSGAQCGLEAAVIFNSVYLTGRIAASSEALKQLDIEKIIQQSWRDAGYGKDRASHIWGPLPETLEITTNLCFGSFEKGERELRHLSDDQAICVGYACNDPENEYMPPAHRLARRIAYRLYELRNERGAGEIGPDGKVLVQIEKNGEKWRPSSISISINHHEKSDWMVLRSIAEQAVEESISGMPMPPILLNGAGSFISGGPNGDNGLSGKKLVVDAYGPTIPIGGGAWSGKDFRKVDRLGGMLARELALHAVQSGVTEEALVRLSYFPGSERPALIEAEFDGTPVSSETILATTGKIALDNLSVWNRYKLYDLPLAFLARWGHQQANMPWEVRKKIKKNQRVK